MSSTALAAIDLIGRVPDVRDRPFGEQTDEYASATAAIRKRVVRKEGAVIPVAAFQSAL